MRSSGRRVSVFVNESALKAWLAGGKPANTPTTAPQPSSSRSPEPEPRSDEGKDKAG